MKDLNNKKDSHDQIGCGYCILEHLKSCEKHDPNKNQAHDCDDFKHWEDALDEVDFDKIYSSNTGSKKEEK